MGSFRLLMYAMFAVVIALIAVGSPTRAQSLEAMPSVDENGVDLSTGEVQIEGLEVNLGSFRDLADLRLAYLRSGIEHKVYLVTSEPIKQVVRWDLRTNFNSVDANTWTAADGSGETLTWNAGAYTLTDRNGGTYVFGQAFSVRCQGSGSTCFEGQLATKISRASGDEINIEYKTAQFCEMQEAGTGCLLYQTAARVDRIYSNSALELRFYYAANEMPFDYYYDGQWEKVTRSVMLNNASGHCASSATSCPASMMSSSVDYTSNSYVGGDTYTLTSADGRVLNYTHNGTTRLSGIRYPGHSSDSVTYSYTLNRATQVTAFGVTTTYSYNEDRNAREFTATVTRGGASASYVFDYNNSLRLKRWTDQQGKQWTYSYDLEGRLTSITSPEGDSASLILDARGNVAQTVSGAKPGSGLSNITTSAVYASGCGNLKTCNQPVSIVDARNNQTDFAYDPMHGQLTQVTLPAAAPGQPRARLNYSYTALYAQAQNSSGTLVNVLVPQYKLTQITACPTATTCTGSTSERKVTYAYNSPNLLLTSMTVAAGDGSLSATTSYTYDMRGNLTSVDGPLLGTADTIYYFYDSANRLVGTIGGDPDDAGPKPRQAQRTDYDSYGRAYRLVSGTAAGTTLSALQNMTVFEATNIAFDANSRRSAVTTKDANGAAVSLQQFSYDTSGRLECVAIRMNSAAWGSLPASACMPGTVGSAGSDRIHKNAYDLLGRIASEQVIDSASNVITLASYTYTDNGRTASITDGANNRTTFEYDGHDRLKKTRFPVLATRANASSTVDYEELTYDAASNVVAKRLRDGSSIGLVYDALDRLVSKDLPGSAPDISYTYDLMGRLIGATQASSSTTFGFDALGRNTTLGGAMGTMSYQYDTAGRRTRVTWPDSFYVSYDYLVTGEVSAVRENGAGSGVGVLASYIYDDYGRRSSMTRGNGTVTNYGYDAASRLSSLSHDMAGSAHDVTTTFAYNPAGQLATTTRSNDAYRWTGVVVGSRNYYVNGLNQYSSAGSVSFGYDARGNLTSSGPDTYAYDSENRLVSGPGGVSLAYDPMLRVAQLASGGSATRFQYDGARLVTEYDGANTLQRRYVHGAGADEPLVAYSGSGTNNRTFLYADERGSIVAQGDSSGAATGVAAYDAFGIPSGSDLGRFRYTGQMWLAELGLYYYKARIYSPTLGRFLQTDPIGFGDGPNLYAYAGNDPVNMRDPTGRDGEEIVVTGSRDHMDAFDDHHHMWQLLRGYYEAYNDAEVAAAMRPERPTLPEEVVVTGRKKKKFAGYKIDFSKQDKDGEPVEQYFRVDDGVIKEVLVPTVSFDCGGKPARGAVLSVAARGADEVIHVHPYGVDFYPGPRDYSIPRAWGIPVWGISPVGVWRVDPGPPITVNLIGDKSKWGGPFDKAKWEKEANGPPPPPCKKVP